MNVRDVRKEQRGATMTDLAPTYLLTVEISQSAAEVITNNTERAAHWRAIQDAIAAYEASR